MTSFETFLLLLENSIRLEEIRVVDVLLEDADRSGGTISLPCLDKFSYSGDIVYPFLHRLSAPQHARFSLTFTHPTGHSTHLLRDVLPASMRPLGILSLDPVSLQTDHPSFAISICDSKGACVHINWLDEESLQEPIDWDPLDLHAVREARLSISSTMRPGPVYLHAINILLERTTQVDTLSLFNQGGTYESFVLSMITPRSTGRLLPSLNKIRFAGPAQGFPLKEITNLVRARKEDGEVSDIRHVDVLFVRDGSVFLEELGRLVSVDVKIIGSCTVPDEWGGRNSISLVIPRCPALFNTAFICRHGHPGFSRVGCRSKSSEQCTRMGP